MSRERPAGFVVRRRGQSFAVPATRGYAVLAVLWPVAFIIPTWRMVDIWKQPGEQHGVPVLGLLASTSVALWFVIWVRFFGVVVLLRRPVLELTPGGVVVRERGQRVFPWEVLRTGTPARGYGYGSVELVVDRPELVRRPRWVRQWWRVGVSHADVDPWFFADAVRFYVDHPDRRAAIGTPAELTRLTADFGLPVPAAWPTRR